MKELPILFRGDMVRAVFEGKGMTRRIVKPQPTGTVWQDEGSREWYSSGHGEAGDTMMRCPYGKPGGRLWVRETWGKGCRPCPRDGWRDGIEYRADEPLLEDGDDLPLNSACVPGDVDLSEYRSGWRPSIHMPRWACRLTLEVTGIRVERLQAISESDCIAEGWRGDPGRSNDPDVHRDAARDWYSDLWDSLNAKRVPWSSNPHVWVIEFRRLEP